MDMQEKYALTEQNLRQALRDYRAHTYSTEEIDDCSDEFIYRLARDSVTAKQNLRELFRKSPVWDENLDALVINGTRTHNPEYDRIRKLAQEILWNPLHGSEEVVEKIYAAIRFFADPNQTDEEKQYSVDCINALAPKAYTPTKKLSRVFKALCTALGVADETAGSEFQRLYAQFADELTAKKIGFKLYVSINPAHFLTMSNPKGDNRGNTLTSCHSFNSTEYSYNNGCTGYARDEVSFIVFTVADPKEAETLNNRKTTRQVFAYRPGSGLLMQSRMYNTSGGVYGAAEDSKLYRDLVQREISMLENMPNLWQTYLSVKDDVREYVEQGEGFGGYADWTYRDFDGHISFRNDCNRDEVAPLEVGTWGLCIRCGCECSEGLYCDDCKQGDYFCDECEEYFNNELTTAIDDRGNEIQVCDACLERNYTWCEVCEQYHHNDNMTYVESEDRSVCDDCIEEYYERCHYCDEYFRRDNMTRAHDDRGYEIWVCDDCRDNNCCLCERCEEIYDSNYTSTVYDKYGDEIQVCDDCIDEYEVCPHCEEHIEICEDGTCPHCGAVIENEEEAE